MSDNPTSQQPHNRPRKRYRRRAVGAAVVVLCGGLVAACSPQPAADPAASDGDAEALTECHERVADELDAGTEEWAGEDVNNRGGGEYSVRGTVNGYGYSCVITRSGDAWQVPDHVIVFGDDAPATTEAAPTTTTAPPTTTTTVPPTTTTTAPPEDPQVAAARSSARSYLEWGGFSRQGLIDQLSSEFGEQFPVEAATAAVDSMNVDWFAEAVDSAESYTSWRAWSHAELVDQLSSAYGEQFTPEQAEHGATVVLGY